MADLESAIERHSVHVLLFFTAAVVLLTLILAPPSCSVANTLRWRGAGDSNSRSDMKIASLH